MPRLADDHRLALHRPGDLGIGLVLLVLVGQPVAVHEQEFRAEQTDAVGARFERVARVLGQLDVRHQLDRDAVPGPRHPALELAQGDPAFDLRPQPLAIAGEIVGLRLDADAAGFGVEHDQVALGHRLARVGHAEHGRQPEAARHDRGVRRAAAQFGDEAGDVDLGALLQVQHVGRRQVARDQDQPLAVGRLRRQRDRRVAAADERLHHPFDDLAHVLRAAAEILVVDGFELLAHRLELDRQRPLGVDQAVAHQVARLVAEQRIVEDHLVQVEEGAHLARRLRRHVRGEFVDLRAHQRKGVVQARHFVQHILALDRVMARFELGGRQPVGAADGNARAGPRDDADSHQFAAHPLGPLVVLACRPPMRQFRSRESSCCAARSLPRRPLAATSPRLLSPRRNVPRSAGRSPRPPARHPRPPPPR